LKDYLIIDQYSILAEHFTKKGKDEWGLRMHHHIEDIIMISSVTIGLLMKSVYKNVILEKYLDENITQLSSF